MTYWFDCLRLWLEKVLKITRMDYDPTIYEDEKDDRSGDERMRPREDGLEVIDDD